MSVVISETASFDIQKIFNIERLTSDHYIRYASKIDQDCLKVSSESK